MNSCSIQCSHIVLVAAQVTVLELANMLTLSRQQEYSLVQRGHIPSIKIAGSIRLDPAAIVK
jgi:hypothetical protein